MATLDPRVDAYIAAAAPFAQPLLIELRAAVHAACPEVSETIKWRMPFFELEGPLCFMAAFKAHCGFGFWKAGAAAVGDSAAERDGMGQLGRLTTRADLPSRRALVSLIRKAAALKQAAPAKARPRTPVPLVVPEVLAAALGLKKHQKAAATFEGFSLSQRRDYADWISEARTEPTRERRLAQALEWLGQGRPRHWKHLKS